MLFVACKYCQYDSQAPTFLLRSRYDSQDPNFLTTSIEIVAIAKLGIRHFIGKPHIDVTTLFMIFNLSCISCNQYAPIHDIPRRKFLDHMLREHCPCIHVLGALSGTWHRWPQAHKGKILICHNPCLTMLPLICFCPPTTPIGMWRLPCSNSWCQSRNMSSACEPSQLAPVFLTVFSILSCKISS